MKKTTKKLLTLMCSLAVTACLGVGGTLAFSHTARAQAEGATAAQLADFDIEGVGAIHNHFHNGSFYQLTLDFNQSGLAFNQHASAVSGITFNGVPVTCGGAPSGDSIMVITLGSGLWIHYTAEQAASGYKGYSHATIHFAEGATVTDVNGATMTYAELTLYLVNGAWTTTRPEDYGTIDNVNYTPNFISIGDLNHVYSEGLDAYGVSLNYNTTGFAADGAQETALSFSGFSLNGEEIGVALWGGNQVLLWLAAGKCANGYNGYSHPTLVINDGAKVTNSAGKEFTLGGASLYLVDGAWTTAKPEGYHVEKPNAEFTDFTVDGVGGTRNHFDNGSYYEVTLDFNQSGLAFNQHAMVVSGMTFNGVPMTCGGAPSGDSIMVITLGSGLWIHYTYEQAASGYKNYSHPTIYFEEGATVTDVYGETTKYAELTLYLVDGAWTTVKPEGYKIVEPAKDTTFTYLGKTEETNNGNLVTLYFVDENEWTDDIGTLADKVLLGDVSLNSIGGSITKGERSLTIAWEGEYTTLTILEEAVFAGQNIPQMTLYLNDGEWSFIDKSKEATVSCFGPASSAWDNVEYKNGYSTNVFKFSENFGEGNDKTNQAASVAYLVATGLKINGVTFYEMYLQDQNTRIDYDHGYNYLQFIFPKEYLESADGEYPVLTIEKGTTFMNQVLPEGRYILYAGHWFNAETFNPNPLPYNGIAEDWNNSVFSGVSNTVLLFGEQIRDENDEILKCDFLGPDNGTVNHADHTNLANPAVNAPIATALTLNGKAISELYVMDNSVQVSYAHGYNYFFIAIPEYMLAKDGYGCATLHIEGETLFIGCVLSEVTLYFHEGKWTSVKPDIVESEDVQYTTISDLFGEETKALSGAEKAESALTASDSVIYKFLLKNDGIANSTIFSTHYEAEFDGIKVVFTGDLTTGRENVLLFVNGREIARASYIWTESEWSTVRIAVDVEEMLSVSVAIDGVYLIKETDVAKDGLGTKIGIQNEKGNNLIADYKVGDVKKPVLYWQGEAEYRYEVNTSRPADNEFQSLVFAADNKDGIMHAGNVQVLWQDGAITDEKLNEGVWIVTLSISDLAGNTAQHAITIVVEDPNKVTVTFDGVATDTIYYKGDLLAEPETPVKEGYTFEGWYVGDVKWDFVSDVITGDLSLTAKFVEVEITLYTIILTSEGLEKNYVYTLELARGVTVDQTTIARDGYVYELYVDGIQVQTVVVEKDTTIKIVYKAVEDEVVTPPDNSSTGTSTSKDSKEDGCGSVVSFGGMGLTVLLASAATLLVKKKKD